MKHIKKKFLIQGTKEELKPILDKCTLIDVTNGIASNKTKQKKGSLAYISTETGFVYGGFLYNLKGKNLIFPIPDPTLIYFHNAQITLKTIDENLNNLINKSDLNGTLKEPGMNDLFSFYGFSSIFIIMLFTSIEAFLNSQIPNDYVYKNKQSSKTELYDWLQIQKHIDFSTKIKKILPEITGKSYFTKSTINNELILNLKEFRDDIIHTKNDSSPLIYHKLIDKAIKFKYDKTIEAVAHFINYYKPNYIEVCNCGKNF